MDSNETDARWAGWEEWRSDAFYHIVDWAAEYLAIVDHRALDLIQRAIGDGWPKTARRLKTKPELALSASVFGALAVLGDGLNLLRSVLDRHVDDAAVTYALAVVEVRDLQVDEDEIDELTDISLRMLSQHVGGSVQAAWELSESIWGGAWPPDFDLHLAAAAHTGWINLATQLEYEASAARQEAFGYVARCIAANKGPANGGHQRELP
jgi:hypothetical protein